MSDINVDAIRKRLDALKNSTQKQNNLWKPQPGKSVIRILPYKYNPENPLVELYFHFDIAKRPILSPASFGEPDPIVEFAEKIRKTGNRDDWELSRKLQPKMRVFTPIVVRGDEKSGVKFWGFGKTVYEQLLKFLADPDEYGKITDPETGRDVLIEFQTAEETGKSFPTTIATLKMNQTPITRDSELLEKLLQNQKNIVDIYAKLTYKELEDILEKYLNPPAEGEEATATDEVIEDGETTTIAKPKVVKKPAEGVEDVGAAFDKLFKDAKKKTDSV